MFLRFKNGLKFKSSVYRFIIGSLILFSSNFLTAQFIPGNLVVLVAGDGTTTLSSAAAKITLKEISKTGSTSGLKSVVLPSSISGTNRRLVQSGSATSEGCLTLSEDSRYLTCVGYDTTVGTASVVSLTTPKRIIARIDSLGTVNSSTQTTSYGGNNIRGAVTSDGSTFWTTGANTGVVNISLGTTGAGTVVSSTITNTRWVNIMNGQLYVSSATGTYQSISAVGTGKPTNTGNSITALSGLPTTGGNSFGFLFLDRSPSISGPDLLYVADQTLGILKYSFDGSTWTARGSVTGNAWGLAGFYNASTSKVELYVTLGTTANNSLYKIEDAASPSSNITNNSSVISSVGTQLYSAGANNILRGVAFTPYSNPYSPDLTVGTTGGGGICNGSTTGLSIGVAKSQRGINYQLKKGNNKVSTLIAGTGGAVTFGNFTVSGTYRVMTYNPLTNDSAFLIDSAVIKSAKLVLSITKSDSVKCYQGNSGALSVGVLGGSGSYSYLWNDASKQTTNKASNLKKGVYKVIVKDIWGCVDSTSAAVNEPAKVALSVSKIDSVKCYQGSDGAITTSITGGSSGYKYTWNDAGKQTTSKSTGLKKGNYKLIVTDIYGCSDSISATVNEPSKVSLSITKIDSVKCYAGINGAFTTAVTGGSNGYKYLWNDASKQTMSKAINLKKGVYKVVVKDLYGCSDSISGTVNEPAKVTLSISKIDSVKCYQGVDGGITTSISGGSNGYKYLWNDASKQTTSKALNLKKGVYKVIVKDLYGCSDSISAIVNEPAKVTLSITKIDSVKCYAGINGAITTAIIGGSNGYKYLWNDASKQTTSKALNLKKGVYKVIVKDIYGCSDSISAAVNEPLKVVTKIIATDSVNCFNGSDGSITTATTGGSNGYKYYWNDASKQTTSVAKSLKKGVYKMIIKDIYGCSDSLTAIVNEPTKVIVTLVSIDSVNCYNGDDGSIVMKYVGGNNGFKFIWEDFTRNTTTMTVDSKISKIKKGVYRLTASDIYGCYDTLSAKVNEPAKVTVNITSIDSVNCFQGSDGSITTNTTGGSNGYKFLWNDKNNQKTSKALGLKKGTYKLLVTDFYGCKDSVVGIVQEPIKVSIQVTQVDSGFCFGYSDGSVATITSGGTGSYKWRWNTTPVQTTSKAIGLKKGSYTVIVKDVYGCSDSATGIVNDPEQIVPKISLNRLTMKGLPHDLSAVITPNKKYKYDWKPSDVFYTVNTLSNPRVRFSETTKVELTVTDYKGCKGYDSVTIIVVQPLSEIIPTGFTPNFDNLNEGFGLPDIFEIQAFDVYNRWGEIVFRGGVSMPRWDGKINGDLAPTGTYSYTIQALLKGTDQIVKHGGSITLIR